MGAVLLSGLAERLEVLSRKEGLGAVGAMVAECDEQYARAAAELRTLLA